MHILTEAEQRQLLRIDRLDSIDKLTILSDHTIGVLKARRYVFLEDLVLLGPHNVSDVQEISEEEFDKLRAVLAYVFNGVYDNLHG